MRCSGKDTRFAQALLYSVLAHFLLLSLARLPPPLYVARPAQGVTVSLRAESPAAPASLSASPDLTAVPTAAPPLRPPEAASRRPPLLARPSATSPARAPEHTEAAPVIDAAAADAAATSAATNVDAGEAAQARAGSEGVGQDADSTEGQAATCMAEMADTMPAYKIAIGDNARKLRRYPERAREMGHEGRVEIRLIWRPGMAVPQVELQQGSGSALLDRQGLGMLRQAAARTPLPEALRRCAFSLVLPVEFSLDQQGSAAR
jgi:protein TonB